MGRKSLWVLQMLQPHDVLLVACFLKGLSDSYPALDYDLLCAFVPCCTQADKALGIESLRKGDAQMLSSSLVVRLVWLALLAPSQHCTVTSSVLCPYARTSAFAWTQFGFKNIGSQLNFSRVNSQAKPKPDCTSVTPQIIWTYQRKQMHWHDLDNQGFKSRRKVTSKKVYEKMEGKYISMQKLP